MLRVVGGMGYGTNVIRKGDRPLCGVMRKEGNTRYIYVRARLPLYSCVELGFIAFCPLFQNRNAA